jgi:hypothetical protein
MNASIPNYLRAIAALALEVAAQPRLLPLFLAGTKLAPKTISELRRAEGLAA